MEDRGSPEYVACSFCGKGQGEVSKLIAGPGVYICNECISLCGEILREEWKHEGKPDPDGSAVSEQETGSELDSDVFAEKWKAGDRVIARRKLSMHGPDGSDQQVETYICAPRAAAAGGWGCENGLRGEGWIDKKIIFGVDEQQALELGLANAHHRIMLKEKEEQVSFFWSEDCRYDDHLVASTKSSLYMIMEGQADVGQRDRWGNTLLHDAAAAGPEALVMFLVEKLGADVNVENNQGKTALDLASERKRSRVVKMLQGHMDKSG